MNFITFKTAVAKQFKKMSEGSLYTTDVEKDALWDCYLSSFPEGTNPIYREKTEHDCNCCKQFIRDVGAVVSIVKNELVSIWDIDPNGVDEGYIEVANALSALVKSKNISNIFISEKKTAGTDKTFNDIHLGAVTRSHFFVNIPEKFVKKNNDIGPILSGTKATHDVFLRSLKEISPDSVELVLELIDQNSIYRGNDYSFILKEFKNYQNKFEKVKNKDIFVWDNIFNEESVLRIRNTAIGTLLVDLSDGKDLEKAVSAFERMVAPTNYKRPTALVTTAMVEKAKKTIENLGLTSALERRYARLDDININNILFADRDTRNIITNKIDELFDGIDTAKPKTFKKVEEIGIDDFIDKVLPTSKNIELFLESRHEKNLVSLVTSIDPTSANLFKWDNHFSWSYSGELADSLIKEKVKKAGGNIEGDLCCRLAWFNHDDLDFHMKEPNGSEIYYGNKSSSNGGKLDVDMNAGGNLSLEPVENIFYRSKSTMKEGVYTLYVHQFSKRETKDIGFEVEVDIEGTVHNYQYAKSMAISENVEIMKLKYSKSNGFEILSSLDGTTTKKEFWNVKSGEFHKVNIMMFSPNYWDGQIGIGNKHYFFMLENCKNDTTSRGFYNEFLKPELNEHRKVFEILGSKLKVEKSDDQLSGIGISSTQKEELVLRVTGKSTRMLKVKF